MKALIITDVHADHDAAFSAAAIEGPDFVLDCGDHERTISLFDFIPHFYVSGNHEPEKIYLDISNSFPPSKVVGGEIYVVKSGKDQLRFSGISGNYSSGENNISVSKRAVESLKRIGKGSLDVLMLHESPLNVLPNSPHYDLASEVIREIDRISPTIVFSGHTGKYSDDKINDTWHINLEDMAKGYGVLDINGHGFKYERKKAAFR